MARTEWLSWAMVEPQEKGNTRFRRMYEATHQSWTNTSTLLLCKRENKLSFHLLFRGFLGHTRMYLTLSVPLTFDPEHPTNISLEESVLVFFLGSSPN